MYKKVSEHDCERQEEI